MTPKLPASGFFVSYLGMKYVVLAIVCLTCALCEAQLPADPNATPTWEETISFYRKLTNEQPKAKLTTIGKDDNGSPIHLFVISSDGAFSPDNAKSMGKGVLFINNAIHPGEPCGVNASMMLADKLLNDPSFATYLESTVICIVPIYNVSGAQRRGAHSRANQKGPIEYGFRGNAKNLDLNRDFIKMDSQNAWALTKALRNWDPDVFVDTHTTDGADHQYPMTLLAAQDDRLEHPLKDFMNDTFKPMLYEHMEQKELKMCPYFWPRKDVPDNGIIGFDDSPRYSSGYATLHNSISFVTEAHMLKPFPLRVEATYELLIGMLKVMSEKGEDLRIARHLAKDVVGSTSSFSFNHELNESDSVMLNFAAVKHSYMSSPLTGAETYRYFPEDHITIDVPYFDAFVPSLKVAKPEAYIIPQEWTDVIDRLAWNQVPMSKLQEDEIITVSAQRIADMETGKTPYEGHYLHYEIKTETEQIQRAFRKGDVRIPMGNETDRFVVEVLEPRSIDSYFAWGFFDSVLQQKEWYSTYVFEEKALDMLANDESLRMAFEKKKASDTEFANNGRDQLYWLYKRSPHYERTDHVVPVYRVENAE